MSLEPRLGAEPAPPWPDDVFDAVALLDAVLSDDLIACGAVLRNMDPMPVAINLALLAAGLAEEGEACCRSHLRAWGLRELLKP